MTRADSIDALHDGFDEGLYRSGRNTVTKLATSIDIATLPEHSSKKIHIGFTLESCAVEASLESIEKAFDNSCADKDDAADLRKMRLALGRCLNYFEQKKVSTDKIDTARGVIVHSTHSIHVCVVFVYLCKGSVK